MNKRTKILVYVLLASIALAFIVFGVLGAKISSNSSETASSTVTTATSTTPGAAHPTTSTHKPSATGAVKGGTVTAAPAPAPEVLWTYTIRGKDQTGQAYADVTANVNGNDYDLGTFPGTCTTLTDDKRTVSGELSGSRCMAGSSGSEIGIFRQGTGFVIKKATVKLGTQGNPDEYGAFTVVTPVS